MHRWAGLLEFCLKYSRDPKLVTYFKEHEVFSIIRQLGGESRVVGYVSNMLEYIIYSVDTKHGIDISEQIIKELPEYREAIMSLGDRLIEQGEQQRAAFIASNLLAKGMTVKEVKELTGLTYKEIRELKEKLED